jgi:processive 1,2-diacylglycerol beta-glucosyltransferase
MAAARAVRRHLETTLPDSFEVCVHDLSAHVRLCGRPMSRAAAKLYSASVANLDGRGYRRLYQYADRHPRAIGYLAVRLFGRKTRKWLAGHDAAVIIATHPLAAQLAAQALHDRATTVISVVTDAGRVNRLWWEGGSRLILVTHGDLLTQIPRATAPAHPRAVNVGLIADPDLAKGEGPAAARYRIGLDEGFTVLLSAGGLGYGPNLGRLAHRLSALALPTNVRFLVATGANVELREEIMKALSPWSPVACPTDGLADMLLASDLVVGKAGWLTASECIVAGRPIIIVDQIPGQEDENAKLIEELGIGRRTSVEEAAAALCRYASDPIALSSEFTIRRDLHDPTLGTRLASIILDLSVWQPPVYPGHSDHRSPRIMDADVDVQPR